jgi:hypothetical protein
MNDDEYNIEKAVGSTIGGGTVNAENIAGGTSISATIMGSSGRFMNHHLYCRGESCRCRANCHLIRG